ncbi:protein EE17 [Elephantid betaherpesvirus 1]|uniref:Protein EE17 n=1 Tax=Elephantid herpesvirus 1 TaxID=146015 RepID=M4JZ61_ELHV1|nr:protein EE17 [Elephantid betaherpesvirus 1]
MAAILLLLVLVTIVTGLSRNNRTPPPHDDTSGSGSGSDDEGSGEVATSIGLNASEENFFTPSPSYPPEYYLPTEGEGEPLVFDPDEGFYIRSDGSGDPDDEDGLQEVDFLSKAFELTHPEQ